MLADNHNLNRNLARIGFGLLWLLPVLLAWVLWQMGGALAVDIGGSTDEGVVEGFHAREANDSDTYRWSTRESRLHLPAHPLPGVLVLRGAVAPDTTEVTLHLGERTRAELPTHSGAAEMRRYLLLWPEDSNALGWSTLDISAQPPDSESARAEQRAIGMLVAGVEIRSPGASSSWNSWTVGPPLLLALAGLLPLLLTLCLRLAGVGWRIGGSISLTLAVALVLVWGRHPLWVQPFLVNTLFILLALLGLIWWAQQTAARRSPDRLPWVLVVLVGVSGIIPLYLLMKYGISLEPDPRSTDPVLVQQFKTIAVNLPILAMLAALALPFVPRRARAPLAGVLVVALLVYGAERFVGAIVKDYATDFTALFRGARSFVNGEQLYNLENIRFNHLGDTYKYPPFFVFLMGPITGMFYVHAIWTWHIINFVLLLLAALLLWRWSGQPFRSWSTLGLVYMLLTFKPVVDTISGGQADIIMLVSLAGALLALKYGRWAWWGAILAFPAAVKLYAGYLLVHAVALGRWRAVAAFAVAFALLNGLAVVVFGWQVHRTFLFEVLPSIGGGTAWIENQTLNGFFNRLTADRIGLIPDDGGIVRVLTYASALLLTALAWWRVRRMSPDDGFGLWIVTLLIILPIAWMHYQAILVVPFYQLFVRLEAQPEEGPRLDWRALLLYALAWALLCYGNQWTFFDRTMYEGPLWTLGLSYKLYGLLLLWSAVALDPTTQAQPVAAQQTEQVRPSTTVMQT